MKFRKTSREEFFFALNSYNDPQDKFAKTFISKADYIHKWDQCIGCWDDEDNLMGAILTTVSKSKPYCANLQLLHTFARYRRKGVAKKLCEKSLEYSLDKGCFFFRVSSERDAVEFYRSIGFKFWGEQKSGTLLSLFKIK